MGHDTPSGPELASPVAHHADGRVFFWCEACACRHVVEVSDPAPVARRWGWNGDLVRPTFTPSVRVTWRWPRMGAEAFGSHTVPADGRLCCHFFVTDGQIRYLGDCTHGMAGQTRPLVRLEDLDP